MQITVTIDSCRECRHAGHTGAFTKGGSKPVCGHRDYCKSVKSDGEDRMSCFDRILMDFPNIPQWCVLKHGSCY